MRFTVTATNSDARPPCRIRERMSFPFGSVPSRWPGENDGRLDSSTFPPTGAGIGNTTGPRKHARNTNAVRPAGTQRLSLRAHARRGRGASTSATVATGASTAAIADPRVEYGVEQIGDEVRHHGHHGEHDHAGLDDHHVPGVDGLHHE